MDFTSKSPGQAIVDRAAASRSASTRLNDTHMRCYIAVYFHLSFQICLDQHDTVEVLALYRPHVLGSTDREMEPFLFCLVAPPISTAAPVDMLK
ncbi:hypothetical protein RRG08_012050 [Elysia crispata]|uniref:Uncharacterized protein n=1 Tax=Elysia crispata TaxID=231223 RepID=A0AAE1CN18_9GAST|nr:hypothetical protein RRG08_012050 [Elysia crispata]